MKKFVVTCFLLLTWSSTTAFAAAKPWGSLSAEQHDALAPLAQEWDKLPASDQQQLLNTAKGYARLGSEEKARFHISLPAWVKLTPVQREAARDKYKAFQKVPADQQEKVRQLSK